MELVRRTATLRAIALVAIGVSAVLTADHLMPGRAFCPLADACAAAAESKLGSLYGVPTAALGIAAFGALFLLTLLPPVWVRRTVPTAGILAAMGGIGLFTYQLLALDAFCPLCLVADTAGVVAGLATLAWPPLPFRRSGRIVSVESISSRVAWCLGVALVALVPFAVPREQDPGWEAITPLADAAFDLPVEEPLVRAPRTTTAAVTRLPIEQPGLPAGSLPSAPGGAHAEAFIQAVMAPAAPEDEAPAVEAALAAPDLSERPAPAAPLSARTEAPAALVVATVRAPTPIEAEPAPLMVEYLNAFCAHCRATHQRLERVVGEMRVPLRRRRVYTWAGGGVPLWARACAIAGRVGSEEPLFRELLRARNDDAGEVYAAAKRAGLDVRWLQAELARGTVPARLVRDRRLVDQARIRALPTLDIGRRRLAGSQSEEELRAAIRAAIEDLSRDERG